MSIHRAGMVIIHYLTIKELGAAINKHFFKIVDEIYSIGG
jgi:hypothetical protein